MRDSIGLSWLLLVACCGGGEGAPAESFQLGDPGGPPIAGGTLLAAAGSPTGWVSDPDHDVVWRVDLDSGDVLSATAFEVGSEPGRLVEGADGRVHVVLRGEGAIATIDPENASSPDVRLVCAEPRGIAYDPGANRLLVACTSGELVTVDPDGDSVGSVLLARDLRDVVFDGDRLFVSRFKSAETLELTADGAEIRRFAPIASNRMGEASPAVGWRMAAVPTGGLALVFQAELDEPIGTGPGSYYGSIVEANAALVLTSLQAPPGEESVADDVAAPSMSLGATALPIDIAVSRDGARYAIAAAGSRVVYEGTTAGLRLGAFDAGAVPLPPGARPVAVAWSADGLVIQLRDPSALIVAGRTIVLDDVVQAHPGHDLFHDAVETTALACASCHPEGREDGHVWSFIDVGPRRTQTLSGGVLDGVPFHWSGDLPGLADLMTEVFVNRMQGPALTDPELSSLASFLEALPAPRAGSARDPEAVERGRALFLGAGGCSSCHVGVRLTNDQTIDVGTGGAFQVPSLVGVSARAPFLHDGCAATLLDRFDPTCGGDRHGQVENLPATDRADLVAFLETL